MLPLIHRTYKLGTSPHLEGASQVALVVKNPPANAGDVRESSLIPESGRPRGGGHGMATQSSILAWRIPWTEEPGGLKSIGLRSQTGLERLSMCSHTHTSFGGWYFLVVYHLSG